MFKKISSIPFCLVCALAAGPALAQTGYDLDFSTDQVTTNTPWEWYMPNLPLVFNGQADGFFTGEGAYIRFYGSDNSPAGHCLELSFTIDGSDPAAFFNVQVDDHGTRRTVMSAQATYSTMRLYVHNTKPSSGALNWGLYFVAPSNVQSGSLAIRRKQYRNGALNTVRELTRDECIDIHDPIPSVYVEGVGSNYTVVQN